MRTSVLPHRVYKYGNHGKCAAIESSSGAFLETSMKRLSEDGSGKWHEGDEHQVQRVQQNQWLINAFDPFEHGMMIDPNRSDDDEADGIGYIRRPQLQQPIAQIG